MATEPSKEALLPTVMALQVAVTVLIRHNPQAKLALALAAKDAEEDLLAMPLSDEQIAQYRKMLAKLSAL